MKGWHAGRGRRRRGAGRAVALGALSLCVLAGPLAACTSGGHGGAAPASATPHVPGADELAAGRAALTARSLLDRWAALGAATPRLATLAGRVAADHRAHLEALGLAPPAASGSTTAGTTAASGSGSGSAAGTVGSSPADTGAAGTGTAGTGTAGTGTGSPPGSGAPPGPGAASATGTTAADTPATLVAAERAAAEQALRDLPATTPATAGLLARMAAARAVHADLLAAAARLPAPGDLPPSATGGSPTPSPSASAPSATAASVPPAAATASSGGATSVGASPAPTPLDGTTAAALSALLTGEHAAVFAYGLVSARTAGARESLARTLWQAHLARRDALEDRIAAAGLTPPEAAAAYDVGAPPTTPADAAALAARVEDGLASVAFGAVTTTTGPARLEAAAALVTAARRAATWRGTPTALPG